MCSYYLDGEPASVRRRARVDLTLLCGLMQFSSSSEGPKWKVFPPRSLRTEQRTRRSHRARELDRHHDQVRSTFWGYRLSEMPPALPRLIRSPWTGPLIELPRKEVIQPQLPLRLPCYDFTPVTSPTFDGCLP